MNENSRAVARSRVTAALIWVFGALMVALLAIRGLRAPDGVSIGLLIGAGIVGAGFLVGTILEFMRRRRSRAISSVLEKLDRPSTIAFLWPSGVAALERLGWQPLGGFLMSVPVVGISIDSQALTVWEHGRSVPTFAIPRSRIRRVGSGTRFESLRSRRVITLEVDSRGRTIELVLNPRTVTHRELDKASIDGLVRAFGY